MQDYKVIAESEWPKKCGKCGHSMKNHCYESWNDYGVGGGIMECSSCPGFYCKDKALTGAKGEDDGY